MDAHCAAEPAADLEGGFDDGVAGKARQDRLEIPDFPGRAAARNSVSSSLGHSGAQIPYMVRNG
jgi:hypothetical protein